MQNKHWVDSYLLDAIFWSRRSHDIHTKCGCILAAKDNTPISHGYNGFMRSIDSSSLPLTRPEKYPFMIHAEVNAIYNAVRQGKSTLGATAYITAKPCVTCLQALYQCGIDQVFYTNASTPHMLSDQTEQYNKIISVLTGKLKLIFVPIDTLDYSQIEETLNILKGERNETIDREC